MQKVETSTLLTGKLCYNAININILILVYVQNCSLLCRGFRWVQRVGIPKKIAEESAELQESSVSCLSPHCPTMTFLDVQFME